MLRFFKKREDRTESPARPSKPSSAAVALRSPPRVSPAKPAREPASPVRRPATEADPPKASPARTEIAAPSVDESRLSDLLTTAIAEQEREMTVVHKVQELVFFEREIGGLANILQAAFRLGQTERVRPLLERLVDAAADLEEVVIARFSHADQTPALELLQATVDQPPSDTRAAVTEAEAEARLFSLESKGESVIDEIRAIRGALVDDEDISRLIAQEDDPKCEEARRQIGRVLQALGRLLRDCVERLAQAAAQEESAEPSVALPGEPPAAPAPESPAARSVTPPALAPAPQPPPDAPAPPPPLPIPPPLPPPPPVPSSIPPPPPEPQPTERATPKEETGLALVRPSGPIDIFPEAPPEPDIEHRSEEEAIHHLQRFYNEHSGDAGLTRSDEQEFERMAQQLAKIVCPDHTFSTTDFGSRLKRLKETFTLRKKLHNALTLPEFKAYFRPR